MKRKGTGNKTVLIEKSSTDNGIGVDSDIYHKRRKTTNYLVGFDDLEPPLAQIIQNNSKHLSKLQEDTRQLNKEFVDNKRQMEVVQNTKDQRFEGEVRACLNEQLTYVTELQSEMFKEIDHTRRQLRDLTWQIAKWEQQKEEKSLTGRVHSARQHSPKRGTDSARHLATPPSKQL